MDLQKFVLAFFFVAIFLGCSNKSTRHFLTKEERLTIDSLGIDSSLVLEVKQLANVDFQKMPGAVNALKEYRIRPYISMHGIQVGYFDVSMSFDETRLRKIGKKWNDKGYGIYTVKENGINRLMIKVF